MANAKLDDLNATVTNLARARQDCIATDNGENDQTVVGHLDAMLLSGLNDGFKEANELIVTEGMVSKDESAAIAAFYSLRRQVLDILKSESDDGE